MIYEDILKDLKNKIYRPVYFLMGEEPYYIDLVTDYIEKNVLSEEEKTFSEVIPRVSDAVHSLLTEGPDATMKRFN